VLLLGVQLGFGCCFYCYCHFGSLVSAGLGLAFPFVGLGFLGYTFVCGSVTLWM